MQISSFTIVNAVYKILLFIFRSPVTTATSIIALCYENGVIIAGDLLGSYGSLARYRNCPRVIKVNDNILLGAGGDYGDFQYVKAFIEQKMCVY